MGREKLSFSSGHSFEKKTLYFLAYEHKKKLFLLVKRYLKSCINTKVTAQKVGI